MGIQVPTLEKLLSLFFQLNLYDFQLFFVYWISFSLHCSLWLRSLCVAFIALRVFFELQAVSTLNYIKPNTGHR